MDRSVALALQTVAVAAVAMPLRVLHAFESGRSIARLTTMASVSRVAWSVVAIVGLVAVGYAHARRTRGPPRSVLAVSTVAALVGVLLGNLFVRLVTDVSTGESLLFEVLATGTYAVLDATMFGLLVVGGFALGRDVQSRRSR